MYALPKGLESAWVMARGKGWVFRTGNQGSMWVSLVLFEFSWLDVDFISSKLTALGMAMVMVRFTISITSILWIVILLARVHIKMTPSTFRASFDEFCTNSLDPIKKPITIQDHPSVARCKLHDCQSCRLILQNEATTLQSRM